MLYNIWYVTFFRLNRLTIGKNESCHSGGWLGPLHSVALSMLTLIASLLNADDDTFKLTSQWTMLLSQPATFWIMMSRL